MRAVEVTALKQQKKHYLAKLRALVSRYHDGQAWSPADKERGDYLETELRTINGTLHREPV